MDIAKWEMIKLGDRVITQCGDKYTIMHDINSGKNVRITTEGYSIVKDICEQKWQINDVLKNCNTEEDKEYLMEILYYLAENNIIRDYNDDTEYKNLDIKIDLDITNRCNLRCKHCCVSADMDNEDLCTERMIDIVGKIVSVKPTAVIISGGEPLVRNDFKNIVDEIKKRYQGYLALMTNAVLMTEELAEYIYRNFDAVSVSLDGVDEETCSAIRGKGVFQKTIEGIKKLQNVGMKKISVSMVVSKVTYNKKHEFYKLCQDLGVNPMIRGLSMVGRAEKEMKDLILPEVEEIEYEKKRIKSDKSKDEIVENPLMFFSCGAAYKQFQIDYRGRIFPCQSLMEEELFLGNVLEIVNLEEYIRERKFINTKGYKLLEQFFPYNFKGCSNCNKQIFCWSCIETLYRNRKKRDGCASYQNVYRKFFD